MAGPLPDRFQPRVLILGSVGTLAATSEIERACYNRAFAAAGLDWRWDAATYARLLSVPGGAARIEAYADETGVAVDADALLAEKEQHFAASIARDALAPRPGIAELCAAARGEGMLLALASTAAPETARRLVAAMRPEINAGDFAFLSGNGEACLPKPAPDIYRLCLDRLGLSASDAVAVEDTPEGAAAAQAAGVLTYAYPGRSARDAEFSGVMAVLDFPDPVRILAMDPCTGTRPITEGERVIEG